MPVEQSTNKKELHVRIQCTVLYNTRFVFTLPSLKEFPERALFYIAFMQRALCQEM